MSKVKLTFHGGVGMVTGSNFLLETSKKKILIDCGFFQGCSTCDAKNLAPFPYNPREIDMVLVTHAHLDHTGRIPRLVREGFRGPIFSTPPTKDIAKLILFDSLEILEEEARHGGQAAPYTMEDVQSAMSQWETAPYHEIVPIEDGIDAVFRDAGHILGSSMVEIMGGEARGGHEMPRRNKIVFSGDLGNSPAPMLRDAEIIRDARYIVIESVYGDKEHEAADMRRERLEDAIEETVNNRGTLLIPAFSIERTQELLFEIERMMEGRKIPAIPVFLDSPLSITVTDVYKKYRKYFNKEVQDILLAGKQILSFPQLRFTRSKRESKEIRDVPNPKIIIAGSGMSNGGRILFHEKEYLPDPKSTLLLVSYQAPGSMGRELQDGARAVQIFGEKVPVRARVVAIEGYSAHADSKRLLGFIADTTDAIEKVFVVMGEPKASSFLTQRLRDYLGVDARMPKEGETVELDL